MIMNLSKHIICLLLVFGSIMSSLTGQCTLSAVSTGGNSSYTQVYVLVDASGDIVAQNTTGTFTSVSVGTYTIHALNYDPSNAPAPLPSALIGMPAADVGSTTAGCFNADFTTDFVTRVCSANTCADNRTVCPGDDIVAISSGGNASYTQVYVLADDSGNFLDWNTTGTFPTGALTPGNTYQVHALNYDPANPPTTLPSDLSTGDPLTDVTGGCFNSDFTTDYLCFTILTSCTTPCFETREVCPGDDIIATSSGGNASYTQVYVLADDSGNFVAWNSTGTFPTGALTAGSTYQVHALNYDPANPPTTLPSDLLAGDPLTDVTGGCFNMDFTTDFLCFVLSCPCDFPSGFIR